MTTKKEADESAYGNLRTLTYADLDKQNVKRLPSWQDKHKTVLSTLASNYMGLITITFIAFYSLAIAVGALAFWLVYMLEEEKRITEKDRVRIQRIMFYETGDLDVGLNAVEKRVEKLEKRGGLK